MRDPFQAYCRISRALRLTLLLEARLAALADEGASAMAAERRLAAQPTDDAEDKDEDEQPEAIEGVQRVGVERDRQDIDEIGQAVSRAMGEIAAMICRDFGLSNTEAEEAHAAFADLTANDDATDDAADVERNGPERVSVRAAGGRKLRRRGLRLGRGPP